MSDWVHCNKCVAKYNTQITFHLAECGHIFCEKCIQKMKPSKKCLICSKISNVITLNKDLESSVLQFFSPVDALMKKATEVLKFQTQQRGSLLQSITAKYNHIKKEYLNMYKTNNQLMKDNRMYQSMLRSVGQNPTRFVTSTPMSHDTQNNITFPNTSMMSSIQSHPPHEEITPVGNSGGIHPGIAKRFHLSSGSSQDPSPAQRVSMGHGRVAEPMRNPGSMGTTRSRGHGRVTNPGSMGNMRSMGHGRVAEPIINSGSMGTMPSMGHGRVAEPMINCGSKRTMRSMGHGRMAELPMIHRDSLGTMRSMEELRQRANR